MKKSVMLLAILTLMAGLLAACGGGESTKVGMVTDAGTIDDKSFNQGTWEGVVRAAKELDIEHKYLKPSGETEADYMREITNLYDAGFRLIVTPGFKFETAIFQAQNKYKDAKFVIIDGEPRETPESGPTVGENTVAIFYAEHESGFLAGVAAAVELKEGDVGFIGGMEIPPVQKFNWGFQQGVAYANENLGTNISMKPENFIYEGSFANVAAGGQLAAQMYDRGVKAIFAAAGGVGVGAIQEAVARKTSGQDVWIIGVDVDQYADGIYEEGTDKSIILTSATKKIDQSAYDMIIAESKDEFPGGQTLTFDAKNDGVGLPDKNPNLSDATIQEVNVVYGKLKAGDITVAAQQGDLIK